MTDERTAARTIAVLGPVALAGLFLAGIVFCTVRGQAGSGGSALARVDEASALRGKGYLEHTPEKLAKYVNAEINCTNCHLHDGTTPGAGSWVGVAARFPQYRARSGKLDTIEDRVNDCFERSLNGIALPAGSQEMTDIVAYLTSLTTGSSASPADKTTTGMPKLKLTRKPDVEKGLAIYTRRCASCHQASGEGLYGKDGSVIYPALWGARSFNIGAGMARLQTAAGFVKRNMPLAQGNTLTDDEAWDVAAYFTQQDRPDFAKKQSDWVNGDRPEDARY